mgnify:CR=1 FL=1
MKEKVKNALDAKILDLGMFVTDVYMSTEEGIKTLNVELDSDDVIDVTRITEASKIKIHKERVVDKYTVAGGTLEVEEGTFAKIDGEYVLDIHSKVKGDDCNE